MPRQCSNFLSTWMDYTSILPTPEIFRKWAALGCISAALGRRVWLHNSPAMPLLYPSLYIMLVGPPGVGKDMALNRVSDLIEEANLKADRNSHVMLGGESVSAKGILDRMGEDRAKQVATYIDSRGKQQTHEFQSLIVVAPELGTLLPEYDTRLVSNLNELYNNKSKFTETIRGGAAVTEIKCPYLVLLLGSQPDTLGDILPDRTFRMGFTSRIIFVFAEESIKQDLISSEDRHEEELWQDLLADFADIMTAGGEFSTAPHVAGIINHFHREGAAHTNVPGMRYAHYNTRRSLHAQKLAMILSAAESNKRVIELHHWEQACTLLFEAEARMPHIFDNMLSSRGFSTEFDEMLALAGPGEIISHRELVQKLARTRAPAEVRLMVGLALETGQLVEVPDSLPRQYRVSP
jgi:hypothetical protein